MADLQQQAEDHRLTKPGRMNIPRNISDLGTLKTLTNFHKRFFKIFFFFNKDMKNTFPKTVHEHQTRMDVHIKTHTLCTIHFERTADRQGPWNAMIV